jgi:hypothetical protein
MEFSIRTLMVVIIIVVALIVFLALIAQWGQEGGNIVDRVLDAFNSLNFLEPQTSTAPLPGEASDGSQLPGAGPGTGS